jgi:uncharacterized membrane protein (TIGR02234 family)
VTERRELGLAVVGCLVGAALVLLAGGRSWVHFSVIQPPLPAVHGVATGHRLAGATTSLGLVILAAAVALVATRRLGRQLAGVLVVAVGVTAVVLALHVAVDPASSVNGAVATATGRRGIAATTVSVTAWPWLAALGGMLATLIGAMTVAHGRRWPAMGRRYEVAPATAPTKRDETSMWDALDRGDDPTV